MSSRQFAPYGATALGNLAARADRGASQTHGRNELAVAELWRQHVEAHDANAREALIMMHLPYARAVAAGLYGKHVNHEAEFDEYMQWATLGLIEALDRYDPGRGAQFTTYAFVRIQGAIRDGLEHISDRQEQLGLHRRLMAERAAAVERSVAAELGRGGEVFDRLARVSVGLMLTFFLDGTGMIHDEDSALPDACYGTLALKQSRKQVRELISYLTPREQSVVKLHYLQGLTYTEIGGVLNITRGRISQLHEQALTRLRRLFAGREATGADALKSSDPSPGSDNHE
ncbi:sigma-70 family RNA polymerase sigma factor [Burkholderia theae]|uniref:sigma-70 family RNA polymerase sigma factor n=1 Tax=Burkholderia theae TaxID=3143496 RepID=UPI003AFB79F4